MRGLGVGCSVALYLSSKVPLFKPHMGWKIII